MIPVIEQEERIRGQSVINRCDFWFAITCLDGTVPIPSTAIREVKRSETVHDYLNFFDTTKLNEKTTVFCKVDYLNHLIQYLNHCGHKGSFKLVTGQSDYSVTDDLFSFVHSHIPIDWYGTNVVSEYATPIPLGLANDYCTITLKDSFSISNKTKLLYMNHRVETNRQLREHLYNHFSQYDWVTSTNPQDKGLFDVYQQELSNHKFMICPPGNGIDTHRTWECLYSDVIPIVLKHRNYRDMEGIIPILFVDDFMMITEKFLNDQWEKMNSVKWDASPLTISYWMNMIRR